MAIVLDGTGSITGLTSGAGIAAAALSGQVPDANAPSGSVIQVVSVTKTDTSSTSSTTFVDVPSLSASITPISATSKILVIVDMFLGTSNSSGMQWQLVRGATAIAITTSGASAAATGGFYTETGNNAENAWQGAGSNHLDNPNTTSATTYKVQFRAGIGTAFINRRGAAADFGGVSSITLMEIAA